MRYYMLISLFLCCIPCGCSSEFVTHDELKEARQEDAETYVTQTKFNGLESVVVNNAAVTQQMGNAVQELKNQAQENQDKLSAFVQDYITKEDADTRYASLTTLGVVAETARQNGLVINDIQADLAAQPSAPPASTSGIYSLPPVPPATASRAELEAAADQLKALEEFYETRNRVEAGYLRAEARRLGLVVVDPPAARPAPRIISPTQAEVNQALADLAASYTEQGWAFLPVPSGAMSVKEMPKHIRHFIKSGVHVDVYEYRSSKRAYYKVTKPAAAAPATPPLTTPSASVPPGSTSKKVWTRPSCLMTS